MTLTFKGDGVRSHGLRLGGRQGSLRILVLLELFPIVLAVELWGKGNKKVRFNCDNMVVVSTINNISASSPPVVRLLRI